VHAVTGFRNWKNSESVKVKLKLAVVSSKLICRILTEIVSIYRLNKSYQMFSFPEIFSDENVGVLYFLHTRYMLKGRPNVIPIGATKACGGSDDIAPLIPNFRSRYR
jgi:hypothetical protein